MLLGRAGPETDLEAAGFQREQAEAEVQLVVKLRLISVTTTTLTVAILGWLIKIH